MRTIAILALVAAMAVGAQQMGYVDFQPMADKGVDLLRRADVLDKEPRYTVVGLDITAGREGELPKDREAIGKLIGGLRLGDRLEVYLVHSRSESEQEAVFAAELPAEAGAGGQGLLRAKRKAEKAWAECWEKNITPLVTSEKKQRTDLFGFMRFVSSQKPEFQEHKLPVLLMYTDGQQVGDGFNMEKRAPKSADIDRLKDEDLLPDLSGMRVVFAGFTPTHRISNAHWRKLQTFWKAYGRECGAESVSVTSERRVALK